MTSPTQPPSAPAAVPKKVRFFRFSALIPFALITALIVAGYLVFFDRIVKRGLEASFTAMNGAKVEIGSFDFSLLDTSVKTAHIQWTDADAPMKNLFEIGSTEFTLQSSPLSVGKLVVSHMAVEGLKFDTDRTASGEVKRPAEKAAAESEPASGDAAQSIESFAKSIDYKAIADKIGKPEDIPVVRMAKELEAKVQERSAHWDAQLPGMTDTVELRAASDEVKTISQRKYKLPQDLAQLRKDLGTLKRAKTLVQAKQAVLKEARQNLQADVGTLRDGYTQITSLRDAHLKDLLIDPQNNVFSAENILSALLGRSLVDTTQKYLGYYEEFKGYLPEQKKTPEVKVVEQKHANGTTVDFIRAGALPTVYVGQINLSGSSGATALSGTVRDASSDLSYKPLLLNVDFRDAQGNMDIAKLQGSMSGTTEDGKEGITSSFQLAVHRTPLAQLSGGEDNKYLAGMEGNADITATLDETPQRLTIALRIEGRDVRMNLKPDGMGQEMERLLTSVLAKIDLLTVDLQYVKEKGNGGKTSTRMKSNLEPILNARLRAYVNEEVAKYNRQLRARFDAEVGPSLTPLQQKLDRFDQTGTLATALSDTDKLDAAREKLEKDLEQKLNAEENKAKSKAKDKLEDKLKSLR